jgi:hypothetical protein
MEQLYGSAPESWLLMELFREFTISMMGGIGMLLGLLLLAHLGTV